MNVVELRIIFGNDSMRIMLIRKLELCRNNGVYILLLCDIRFFLLSFFFLIIHLISIIFTVSTPIIIIVY